MSVTSLKFLYIFITLNIISFLMFACDKLKAIHNKRRIHESNLLLASIIAPFGAYLGMTIWKHKTRKPLFSIGILIFMIMNLLILFVKIRG